MLEVAAPRRRAAAFTAAAVCATPPQRAPRDRLYTDDGTQACYGMYVPTLTQRTTVPTIRFDAALYTIAK